MKYAETRQPADVIGLKKRSNTDSDVNSQFIIEKKTRKRQFGLDVVNYNQTV